jgi:hypothetical protein
MQIIEYVANTVSHGMRLFGNMYAGELVFMLIALMGGAAAMSLSGVLLPCGARHCGFHLGNVPHSGDHPAGVHFHDAGADLPRPAHMTPTNPLFPFRSFLSL